MEAMDWPVTLTLLLAIALEGVWGAPHKDAAVGMALSDRRDDYPDFQYKYDEYPMIVPKKRTAMLVDRLMRALQRAIDVEDLQQLPDPGRASYNVPAFDRDQDVRSMDLQRRGHGDIGQSKGKTYWRCYFNAVTCF